MSDDDPNTAKTETWLKIKEVSEITGQPERRIRHWKDSGRIESKTYEDRANAPVFVRVEDVEAMAAERPEEERVVETLPIPAQVFEEIQSLHHRVVEATSAQIKAETQVEFFKEQVRDLKEQIKVIKTEPAVKRHRWWSNK